MTRDGYVFRSIPLFSGALAFLPACNGDQTNVTGADDTGGTTTATGDDTGMPPTSSADDTTSIGESSSDESADTGDPICGGSSACGSAPPVGWFGPVVYARVSPGAEVPTCPPEVSDVGPILQDGFVDPGPAQCGCECQLTAPASCYSYLIGQGGGYNDDGYYGSDGYYYGSGGFIIEPTGGYYGSGGYMSGGYMSGGYVTGYVGTGYVGESGYGGTGYADSGYGGGCYGGYNYVGDGCQNQAIDGLVRFYSYDSYYGGGTCEEMATENIPMFSWAATIATCRIPDTALLCGDDGVCIPPVPDGFEAQWCMYQQGDLECPAGPYPNKIVFWSGYDDTRDCSNCACGTTGSSCSDGQLQVFAEPDCAGVPVATIPANQMECTEVVGASYSADLGAEESCPVTSDSVAEGMIEPTGPFTFCCAD